jgi:hypothetical protein
MLESLPSYKDKDIVSAAKDTLMTTTKNPRRRRRN